MLVAGIIGCSRQLRHKPAGLRTHMLVFYTRV
ncbi:MgtC/SapB family protein [Microcoleus sp. herbarium14]